MRTAETQIKGKEEIANLRKRGIVTRFHSNMVTVEDEKTGERFLCRLRGKFRLQNLRPIVGDRVEYTEDGFGSGIIENILPRKNVLEKPKIANVDQVILVTTLKDPDIPPRMIDRFLVLVEKSGLDVVIIFNKIDLLNAEDMKRLDELVEIYSKYYEVLLTSAKRGDGLKELIDILKGKVSTMAGISGVGKSSLLNAISPGMRLKTGELSKKLRRGRHTTTFTELLRFSFGGYVADTPGFANLDISSIDPRELKEYFPEFKEVGACEFSDCVHIDEPGCAVKEAVGKIIPESRYSSYREFFLEIVGSK